MFMTEKIIKSIYQEVYNLFPEDNGKPELRYVCRNWIFPNHFEIMLDIIDKLCVKHQGDVLVCKLAALLHDTGLVYKRTCGSSQNHEERSIEFAELTLKKYNITPKIRKEIIECIKSTEPQHQPHNTNSRIVRTADALSQFISIHFIAKAAFAQDFDEYITWLSKKINTNFEKICFEDEKKQAKPILDYYKNALQLYLSKND